MLSLVFGFTRASDVQDMPLSVCAGHGWQTAHGPIGIVRSPLKEAPAWGHVVGGISIPAPNLDAVMKFGEKILQRPRQGGRGI
jgi:hypothetical protein